MNKAELIAQTAQSAEVSGAKADAVLKAAAKVIHDALKNGDTVTLPDLGTFSLSERNARTGRNPKTGEPLQIAARKVPAFKAAKAFKDAVA